MDLTIYKRALEVRRFSETVQERGDSERELLGFLPRSAYAEAAAQGKLYVATIRIGGEEHYAGHLLYGGRFPHLRVFQLYAHPQFRRRNIGRALIEALAVDAEAQYFITISARVAADLAANGFWERMGFKTIRVESGGVTTGRQINLRRRELNSPTLFSVPSLRPVVTPIPISRVEKPIYALDVNVFLDIVKGRPRAEHVERLVTAAMSGILRLFVAREFINELSRASRDMNADPVLRLAMALPQFRGVPEPFLANVKRELGSIIFPGRIEAGELRQRDESDLTHLATMIYHSASGFVTSDDAILGRRIELRQRYGIEVLGPAELAEICLPSQWTPALFNAESLEGKSIAIAELEETQREEAERFLLGCEFSAQQIGEATSPGQSACPRHRVIVSFAGDLVGFAAWDAARQPGSPIKSWLVVDPAHPAREMACDVLLDTMFRGACLTRPVRMVTDSNHTNEDALEHARQLGFFPSTTRSNPTEFEKFCIGRIITNKTWIELRSHLLQAFEIVLPTNPPTYTGPETCIEFETRSGGIQTIRLDEFETRFGPVLLVLPDRPSVVIPIQRQFADQLLSTSRQTSLFPQPEASVLGEKLYLSSPRTLSVISPGAILLFYESIGKDGRGAIVAAAQVTRTAVQEIRTLEHKTTRHGVLQPEHLSKLHSNTNTGLTFFNQLFRFERPIGLTRLRDLGCADGANFVTARRINENAQIEAIIEEGDPSVRLS